MSTPIEEKEHAIRLWNQLHASEPLPTSLYPSYNDIDSLVTGDGPGIRYFLEFIEWLTRRVERLESRVQALEGEPTQRSAFWHTFPAPIADQITTWLRENYIGEKPKQPLRFDEEVEPEEGEVK